MPQETWTTAQCWGFKFPHGPGPTQALHLGKAPWRRGVDSRWDRAWHREKPGSPGSVETRVRPGLWQRPCRSGLVSVQPLVLLWMWEQGRTWSGPLSPDFTVPHPTYPNNRANKSGLRYVCSHMHVWEEGHRPPRKDPSTPSLAACLRISLARVPLRTHSLDGRASPSCHPPAPPRCWDGESSYRESSI